MIWRKGILVIACLVLFSTVVSAEIPDVLTMTSSSDWLVANNVDTSIITLHVQNQSTGGNDLPSVQVAFICDDPIYGNVTVPYAVTNGFGLVTTPFRVWNKSGTAPIRAIVYYVDGGFPATKEIIYNQKIDHDSPYSVNFDYDGKLIVNETTTITATLKDRWGNPVDNRRVVENVHFVIGSPLGGAGFWNGAGFSDEIILPVNAVGTVSTLCKIDTTAGDNIVWMERLGSIPDKYFTIVGISEGTPYSMTTEIVPTAFPNPYVAADGMSTFSLKYTLYDFFGNPAGNRTIWVNTSVGQTYFMRSNSLGEVLATYGPKDSTATININAVVVDNTSLTSTLTVEFVSTAPTNIILTGSPETMPSHDVAPSFKSDIMAKVMDIKGNPVPGEVVTFSMGAVTYDGTYNITSNPALLSLSATTDANGYAKIQFNPGGFTTIKTDLNYNPTATGHAVVTALWNGTSRSMTVSWKNYPYLSVETNVAPSTVAVNGTIDVTIRLKGDGWALMPDPIDVVLVTDVSGSMAGAGITGAKNAGKVFGTQLSAQDRIGLESYGWNAPNPWSAKAQDDLPLTFDKSVVNATINTYVATGNTPQRPAIFNATRMITNNPRTGAVTAMILLTDGNWNYCGDPRGISTSYTRMPFLTAPDVVYANQSVVTFAKTKGIKIFTVGLGSGVNAAELQAYATETGGKYYYAPNASQLTKIYVDIAGELKTSAGVNTTLNMSFQNVMVNNITLPGANVFVYVPNSTSTPKSTQITWPNSTVSWVDQTADWNLNHKLNFNVGTIKLNETWEGIFRLRILKDGNIDIFGNDSVIKFEGSVGPSTLTLPHTFITAIPNLNNTGMNTATIATSNLQCTKVGTITDFLPLKWNIDYSGRNTVTEKVSWTNQPPSLEQWTLFTTHSVDNSTMVDYANLDVRSLPEGDYWIKVEAEAPDSGKAYPDLVLASSIRVGSQGKAYIKLE